MTTFVLLIFFWEGSRGYAITSVPGYESKVLCEQAARETIDTTAALNGKIQVRCIVGPSK